MPYTTLISTQTLAANLDTVAIFDCRFDLADPDKGERLYHAGHIPGALYARLNRDLSGLKTGHNGRHPLPDMDVFKATLSAWGIAAGVQVVAYDEGNGMNASRLWWMVRYLGHDAVAVLDGGLAKWLGEGRPQRAAVASRAPRQFSGAPRAGQLALVDEIERLQADPAYRLIDSRAPERYRGEIEPFDPVAGHIPGAVNHFNLSNVNPDGTFRAPEVLRQKFLALLGEVPSDHAITYCGSGVAAAHNVLAMEVAGLSGARIYSGSWSEWCSDPARSVARAEV